MNTNARHPCAVLVGGAVLYDLLVTQRRIPRPPAELNFYSNAEPARRIGAGLSDIDTGLRLRFDISRKVGILCRPHQADDAPRW